MVCSKCKHDNNNDSKFCINCGEQLIQANNDNSNLNSNSNSNNNNNSSQVMAIISIILFVIGLLSIITFPALSILLLIISVILIIIAKTTSKKNNFINIVTILEVSLICLSVTFIMLIGIFDNITKNIFGCVLNPIGCEVNNDGTVKAIDGAFDGCG